MGRGSYSMAYSKLEENSQGKGTGKRGEASLGLNEEKSRNNTRKWICIDTDTKNGKNDGVENENKYMEEMKMTRKLETKWGERWEK